MAEGQMIGVVSVCMWVVALWVATVHSCSPTEQPPLVQRVHMADVVIHGIVSIASFIHSRLSVCYVYLATH